MSLCGRKQALHTIVKLFFERWYTRRGRADTDRTQNPFLVIQEKRILKLITSLARRPSTPQAEWTDEEIKWGVIEAIRVNEGNIRDYWMNTSQTAVDEFCDLMFHHTTGVMITFGDKPELILDGNEGKILTTEMLGLCLAFETQLVDGCDYRTFESFRESLPLVIGEQLPTFTWALDRVFGSMGVGKHLILGVDDSFTPFLDMLNVIGVAMDKYKNLHVVFTSQSDVFVDRLRKSSNRTVRTIPVFDSDQPSNTSQETLEILIEGLSTSENPGETAQEVVQEAIQHFEQSKDPWIQSRVQVLKALFRHRFSINPTDPSEPIPLSVESTPRVKQLERRVAYHEQIIKRADAIIDRMDRELPLRVSLPRDGKKKTRYEFC